MSFSGHWEDTMDKIWAPWRMQYILGVKSESELEAEKKHECVLCAKYKAGPADDRKNLVLFRGKHSFILMNLYPYNSGHLMFVPYTHSGDYESLPGEDVAEMTELSRKMIPVMRSAMNPQGFNLGINLGRVAGAGIIDHVHLHMVPRWNGDCNFMPVLSDTKIISEHIETTYDKIKREIDAVKLI
jgi:ATP adenylyltransferase